jgi:hypothetical protein
MPFSLLLPDLTPPDTERLKRAFRSLSRWTEADAVRLAREAAGILVKSLSIEDAEALQRALQAEGLSVVVVDAAQLPTLPVPKAIRRLEFQPEALAIYDLLGRASQVPYPDLTLLSAGVVRRLGMTTKRVEREKLTYDPIRGIHTKTVTDVRHQVEDLTDVLLDIVSTVGAVRHRVEAGAFLFKYCFDRPDLDPVGKLGLLVRMLVERAPQAALNRGAAAVRDGQPREAAYASKVVLDDECVWRLWRMRQPGSAGGS